MRAVRNHWTQHADLLAPAYARAAGSLRFEIVTRALAALIGDEPLEVLDIGGGFGEQAIRLARLGHRVTILDCDVTMLDCARDKASAQPEEVRERVSFVLGSGAHASEVLGPDRFDLTCTHSVLLYEDDPQPILRAAAWCTRDGGHLSIISTNHEARAMRAGLQGRWRQALATLQSGTQVDDRCLPTVEHRREDVLDFLESLNVDLIGWHGLGVFTDHRSESIPSADWYDVLLCEWLAGNQDPYRRIARAFHLLARVNRGSEEVGRDS